MLKAGAAAMRWQQENKDQPAPTPSAEPPPYNVADAARVWALMARLEVSHVADGGGQRMRREAWGVRTLSAISPSPFLTAAAKPRRLAL